MPTQTVSELRRETVAAKAFAVVLRDEFDAAFTIYDAASAEVLWPEALDRDALSVDPTNIESCAESGRAQVELASDARCFTLLIPLNSYDEIHLIAVGSMTSLARSAADQHVEQHRLERWANAVCERLKQADQMRLQRQTEDDLRAQAKKAWELNLKVERVIRHLRVHKEVNAGIREILETGASAIDAEALIWLPQRGEQRACQDAAVLSPHDVESLINALRKQPELRERGVCIVEDVSATEWGRSYPMLSSVMVFAVPHSQPVGWLVALNKKVTPDPRTITTSGRVTFRRGDAAALAPFSAMLGMLVRANERYQELKDLLVGLTRSLASAVDAKDPYTYGHSERVARIAVELGQEMQLSEDQISDLYLAGLLHDVGKIGVRDDVLLKQGALTPEETEHIRQHPQIGYTILKDLRQISSVLPGVLHHHEQFNGQGYPHGLSGEGIPLIARILAVADSYDAMSTTRPYRQGMSPAKVEQILNEGAGLQWDPRVIDAFKVSIQKIRSIRERGLGESLRQALDGALRESDQHGSTSGMSIMVRDFQ